MAATHRVLIAAQPAASVVLQPLLSGAGEVIPVSTMSEAFAVLAREAGGIDVVICTFGFDESRMLEFLHALKRAPETRDIPFLVVRAVRRLFSDELVRSWGAVAEQSGAAAFLDIAGLDEPAARAALRRAVADLAAARAGHTRAQNAGH